MTIEKDMALRLVETAARGLLRLIVQDMDKYPQEVRAAIVRLRMTVELVDDLQATDSEP